jgi:Fur family transcriptional regulator, ferric uptake regulator
MTGLTRDEAKRRVHEAGLRATAPRLAVLRLLATAARPLSHSEVVASIGNDDWDQATLYRNLLKLVEAELARVASHVGGIARYEFRGEDDGPHLHPHFSCRSCGMVECLPEAKLAGPVERSWHPSLAEAELQLVGDCPSCRAGTAQTPGGRGRPRRGKRPSSALRRS